MYENNVVKQFKKSYEDAIKNDSLIYTSFLFDEKEETLNKLINERKKNLLYFFGIIYGYLDSQIKKAANNSRDDIVDFLFEKRKEVNNDMFNILNNLRHSTDYYYIIKEVEEYPTWKNFEKFDAYNSCPSYISFINAYNLAYYKTNNKIFKLYDKLVFNIYNGFEIEYKTIEENKEKTEEKVFRL